MLFRLWGLLHALGDKSSSNFLGVQKLKRRNARTRWRCDKLKWRDSDWII